MDAQIILTTSDNPPVSLTISRSALIVHSRFFADMFSLNLESDGTSLKLVETEKEVKPLLMIIEGGDDDREKKLELLSEIEWEMLAKLADKYDCWSARKLVEAKVWELEAKRQSGSAAFAFTLATLTGNEHLICHTAKRAVLIRNLEERSFRAAPEWKERLAAWRTLRAARLPGLIYSYRVNAPGHHCDPAFNGVCFSREQGWDRLCGAAYKEYDILRSPPLPVCKFLAETGCNYWIGCIRGHAERFEQSASEWENFPVKGLAFG
ncbi:hypothetical protein JCM5353_006458 [Sporobolomyces roseus]